MCVGGDDSHRGFIALLTATHCWPEGGAPAGHACQSVQQHHLLQGGGDAQRGESSLLRGLLRGGRLGVRLGFRRHRGACLAAAWRRLRARGWEAVSQLDGASKALVWQCCLAFSLRWFTKNHNQNVTEGADKSTGRNSLRRRWHMTCESVRGERASASPRWRRSL